MNPPNFRESARRQSTNSQELIQILLDNLMWLDVGRRAIDGGGGTMSKYSNSVCGQQTLFGGGKAAVRCRT